MIPCRRASPGPAAFLLAGPYVLPGYLGWVLPAAALEHNRRTARIIALQATLLVGAYEIFHLPSSGLIAHALTSSAGLLAPLLGVVLLVAFLAAPRRSRTHAGRQGWANVGASATSNARSST
jgi:hypothetical protein